MATAQKPQHNDNIIAYQAAVNGHLLATTRARPRIGPLLTDVEMAELDAAFARGDSPKDFAATLVARDLAGRCRQ